MNKFQFTEESLFYIDQLSKEFGEQQEDGTYVLCSDDNEDVDEYDYEGQMVQSEMQRVQDNTPQYGTFGH